MSVMVCISKLISVVSILSDIFFSLCVCVCVLQMPPHNDELNSTSTSSRVHPLHRRQSADRISVAKSKLDSVPVPGPSENRFLPPAPVRSSTNDPSPGPPGGGKSHRLSSHDLHRQEAAGEFISKGVNQKPAPITTATSSRSSSSSPSIPPLMNLNFKKKIPPREQSLLTSRDSVGISKPPSSSTSPADGSSVVNLETSNLSKSADVVSQGSVPTDAAFPSPLSQPEKNALPFSGFFETESPRPAVGVSDSYLSCGQKSSPRTKKIVLHSSESSDTLCPDVDTDSDNEGGLVIDESFVSQNRSEATAEEDKSIRESEKSSTLGGSLSSSITNISDIVEHEDRPSSPDCEILSVGTVDSTSSCSSLHHSKAVGSSATRGHRSTPESTSSGSERSKSSVLASLSARHRSIMPAAQRAKKLASSVIDSEFVKKLVEGDGMEQDLLRRFFKAVVSITERLKWKYRSKPATTIFVSYYSKVFHGFVTGSLSQRENVPTKLYQQELKALEEKCGKCVSKWKEQLQRYILRAGTLPKDKKDLDAFVKNQKALVEDVEATNVVKLSSTPDSDGKIDPHKVKPHPPAPPTTAATVQQKARSSSNLNRPTDKPRPPAPPTTTTQQKCHSNSESDGPSDPRKARPLPLPHSTLPTKALRPSSAFTPVISSSSSPSSHSSSLKSSDSRARLTTSPKKPITLLHGQSAHTESSWTFKPLHGSLSESDERGDGSLFTVDRSADYSLDPELEDGRAPDGFRSHSSSSSTISVPSSSEEMIVIDLVGEDLQSPYVCPPPQVSGDLADEEKSLIGEKVTMDIVLSGAKEHIETTPTIADQPGPSKVNIMVKNATSDSSSKLDTTSEHPACSVDFTTTTSESYHSTTETEDGEIISSSPSPAPSPPPEKRAALPPILPMAYRDPERWGRVDSRERELSQQRHWHLLHRTRSPRSRSSSPGAQRRGSSPERFYRRRQSRYRSRSRSRSRDRMLRSRDRRRRSISRDRRSRSRDRRSRDRRYHRSRTRSRSRGKSRSPVRRLRSQKSKATEIAPRRSSRTKDGKGSTDSEDELEILKREALASMKLMAAGTAVKSQEEHSRDGVENDGVSERREIDMDLCSQSSEDWEEEEERGGGGGEGEADMDLCSESSGEGGVSVDGGRREAGKGGDGSGQGNVVGDKEGSSVMIGDSNRIEVTFGGPSTVQNEPVAKNLPTDDKLELSEENFVVDYDVEARPQDKSSLEADTLTCTSQSEEEKLEDQNSTDQGAEGTTSTTSIPAQGLATAVGRSASAPSGVLGGKSPAQLSVGSPTMKQSLPLSATTGQPSNQSSVAAASSSQSSAAITTSSEPSASDLSQLSTAKNSQPLSIAEKPPPAVARSKSSDIASKAGQPSAVRSTQPSLSKVSTGKTTSKPPTATKASKASLAADSQQTVIASSKLPTAKATQGKTTQPPLVKTTHKVADSAAVKSLKKSLSRSSSRSGSNANSPCLSPTRTSSPSESTDSLGVGGALSSDARVRHRSGSCVKVCTLCKCSTYVFAFLV